MCKCTSVPRNQSSWHRKDLVIGQLVAETHVSDVTWTADRGCQDAGRIHEERIESGRAGGVFRISRRYFSDPSKVRIGLPLC
jgi:hypothetical protein